MSAGISYYFDIDRSANSFALNADYHIDPVYGHSQTRWDFEYRNSQGGVIDSSHGYAGATAFVRDGFAFDTGPGIAVRQLEFGAWNTYDGYGFSFFWNVFDAAKETASQTFGGTSDTDILFGGLANDTIRGYGDDDWLDGGAGKDTLLGDLGDDTYVVDVTADRVLEAANAGSDTIRASLSYALPANVETLDLIGTTAIAAVGNDASNTLAGNAADNFFLGNRGADQLIGEGGADTFAFRALSHSTVASSGRDVIVDFSRQQGDHIELNRIDANSGLAGDQAFSFIGGANFSGQAGELRSVSSGGTTVVSGDVDGNGQADFAISLRGHVALNAGDFIL